MFLLQQVYTIHVQCNLLLEYTPLSESCQKCTLLIFQFQDKIRFLHPKQMQLLHYLVIKMSKHFLPQFVLPRYAAASHLKKALLSFLNLTSLNPAMFQMNYPCPLPDAAHRGLVSFPLFFLCKCFKPKNFV